MPQKTKKNVTKLFYKEHHEKNHIRINYINAYKRDVLFAKIHQNNERVKVGKPRKTGG